MNTKLAVTNFPGTHTKEMIQKIAEVFGKVKTVDLLKDPVTGEFKGQVNIEFMDEVDAKKGYNGLMGLNIEGALLHVKRLTTLAAPNTSLDGEMFKMLLEDRPTTCLMLRNVFCKEEIENREDYKELEEAVKEEMMRYGTCLRAHCPKAPIFGDAEAVPGYGKVFVKFKKEEEAEKARQGIYRRRFNDRIVDSIYFPEEKFDNNQFE